MITVKCHYENGDTITTRFNGSEQEARNYFEGQTFNIGDADDDLQKCERIEVV